MKHKIKTAVTRVFLFNLLLLPSVFAAPLQEECDGEKKTCCFAQEVGNVPPMWVNAVSCPEGMIDNADCPLQYGCTAVDLPASKP